MKRDMSLIRKILEYVEAQTDGRYHDAPRCSDFSQESVHYHIGLCGQAGLFGDSEKFRWRGTSRTL